MAYTIEGKDKNGRAPFKREIEFRFEAINEFFNIARCYSIEWCSVTNEHGRRIAFYDISEESKKA